MRGETTGFWADFAVIVSLFALIAGAALRESIKPGCAVACFSTLFVIRLWARLAGGHFSRVVRATYWLALPVTSLLLLWSSWVERGMPSSLNSLFYLMIVGVVLSALLSVVRGR